MIQITLLSPHQLIGADFGDRLSQWCDQQPIQHHYLLVLMGQSISDAAGLPPLPARFHYADANEIANRLAEMQRDVPPHPPANLWVTEGLIGIDETRLSSTPNIFDDLHQSEKSMVICLRDPVAKSADMSATEGKTTTKLGRINGVDSLDFAPPVAIHLRLSSDHSLALNAIDALNKGISAWLRVLSEKGYNLCDLSSEYASILLSAETHPHKNSLGIEKTLPQVHVVANHSALLGLGYCPKSMRQPQQRRRLWLALPTTDDPQLIALLQLIAQLCEDADLDLILLDEARVPEGSHYQSLFRRYAHVYWFYTPSISETQRQIISNQLPVLHNCLLATHVRVIDLENPELSNILIDWRHNGSIPSDRLTAEYARLNDYAGRFKHYPSAHQSRSAICTLITSVFQSDEYCRGFIRNSLALSRYEQEIDHICLVSDLSDLELEVYLQWFAGHDNALLLWSAQDPGLYESWNIGIRLAETEFISNANVDDLRHPDQVRILVDDLRIHSEASIASSGNIPFQHYVDDFFALSEAPWFVDQAGLFGFTDLGFLQAQEGRLTIKANNLPHCMPVWRKQLHQVYGYFDERRFGTFADWAFWLKVTKAGELGYLNPKPLSSYFINPSSHNRRGDRLAHLHKEIEREFLSEFYLRSRESIDQGRSLMALNHPETRRYYSHDLDYPRKLHLAGLENEFGQHRNSFNRLISSLLPLSCGEDGITLIPFIERYFVWGTAEGEAASASPQPVTNPWIGIVHVPFDSPSWFETSISPEVIFASPLWLASMPQCRGLIGLTQDLQRDLQAYYPDLPTLSVKHPTELSAKTFEPLVFEQRRRVVQIGDWLRKLHAIHTIQAPGYEKIMLLKEQTRLYWDRETAIFGGQVDPAVQQLDYVSNETYDDLLSSSVVLCLLYATAANNVVIECIARNTPIIINPLPSVVEYLGPDYPLYAESIREANKCLADTARIRAAHDYLCKLDKSDLTYDRFLTQIAESSFYAAL